MLATIRMRGRVRYMLMRGRVRYMLMRGRGRYMLMLVLMLLLAVRGLPPMLLR